MARHTDPIGSKAHLNVSRRVIGDASVVEDPHHRRMRPNGIRRNLRDRADIAVEALQHNGWLLSPEREHHKVVAPLRLRTPPLIHAGQSQLAEHTPGFLQRLPPSGLDQILTELDPSARQQKMTGDGPRTVTIR
jgi:hypothetical protein